MIIFQTDCVMPGCQGSGLTIGGMCHSCEAEYCRKSPAEKAEIESKIAQHREQSAQRIHAVSVALGLAGLAALLFAAPSHTTVP